MSCESERHIRAEVNVSDCKAKVILNEYLPLIWRDERSRGIFVGVRGGVEQRSPEGNLLCPSIIREGEFPLAQVGLVYLLPRPMWQALMGANVIEAQEQIYMSVKQKSN